MLQRELKTRLNMDLTPPGCPLGAARCDEIVKKMIFLVYHENSKNDPKKVKSDPKTTFLIPKGHHEVPDGARQHLAQGKSCLVRTFVCSREGSKRA